MSILLSSISSTIIGKICIKVYLSFAPKQHDYMRSPNWIHNRVRHSFSMVPKRQPNSHTFNRLNIQTDEQTHTQRETDRPTDKEGGKERERESRLETGFIHTSEAQALDNKS